jgi:3',5'-cyclic AMP phosphodiesterase CpdA
LIRRFLYAAALLSLLAAFAVPGPSASSGPLRAESRSGPRALAQAVGVAPNHEDTIHFGIIGDMGTGSRKQREVGAVMEKVRAERFPFTFVLTVGDNLYGSQDADDFKKKFVVPYKALLDAHVTFHAALGNHDVVAQREYELFNMNGQRYYTFTKGPAQFFALDSTMMTPEQLRWFEEQLAQSRAPWKIAYLHHPLYSSGIRHGPSLVLRNALEPLLTKYGVQVMFSGHEHFYERLVPQKGVQHFITGAGGQLRLLNIRRGTETAAGYDTDNSFMVARIRGDEMYFESINRRGWTIDAGIVNRAGGTRTVSPTTTPQ